METFESFFRQISPHGDPHIWQGALAEACTGNRLIRIPTGFGKTLGVLSTWLWHRLLQRDEFWPRRLVWCLPMRVLVEQTRDQTESCLARLGLLWDGDPDQRSGKVGVHLLMGSADAGDWHLYPEHCAVLIGTQDMLLSRAMNRGYGAPRARWPMEFGLLNQDCLWVMDEVQLMDVGLATSGQLQAFRKDDGTAGKALRPCFTWWMSATLQPDWLKKSPDTEGPLAGLPETKIDAAGRTGHLWDDVTKTCEFSSVTDEQAFARLVVDRHLASGNGIGGPTLVVVNTVENAVKIAEFVRTNERIRGTKADVRLIHSRFRPAERSAWRDEFLNRPASGPGTDRIIIATQVIEAGVDFSAGVLITELAPWSSLVQRFGRCARWGGTAEVVVADLAASKAEQALAAAREKYEKAKSQKENPKPINEEEVRDTVESKAVLPYALMEIRAAREALTRLCFFPLGEHSSPLPLGRAERGGRSRPGVRANVAPKDLEAFEDGLSAEELARLYPYDPPHLLLRHELDELFDTTPDLSGADIDISRFIRSGEERDLQVFWAEVPDKEIPPPDLRPSREALCAVPFLKARNWLCGKETGNTKAPRLKKGMRAWVWDWLEGAWKTAELRDLYPGQTVLVASACGGYDRFRGWNPDTAEWPNDVPLVFVKPSAAERADAAQDDEALSAYPWQTIATHGRQAGAEAAAIAVELAPPLAYLYDLAGRWHDTGKVHPAFNGSIVSPARPARPDLAKAPKEAWLPGRKLYPMPDGSRRPGFRHELASALALFGVLQRHRPDHVALLGPWRELLEKAGFSSPLPLGEERSEGGRPGVRAPNPLEQEILALDAAQFDLLAYLVCAHHGKVRLAWHACPADQAAATERLRIRGVEDGEPLPEVFMVAGDGSLHKLPETPLDLAPSAAGLNPRTGAGWTERVLGLLRRHGPFTLAWLEALLRAADQRASRKPIQDPLLENDDGQNEVARSDPALAEPPSGRTAAAPSGSDSTPRGPLDGDGGGTGRREPDPGTTRPPHAATRYLDTTLGVLSYQELALHLSDRVADTEHAIALRAFAAHPLDEALFLGLHRRICGDLTPGIAGRWRTRDVQVGEHHPPPSWRVAILMHEYAADLAVRVEHAPENTEQRLLETLAFAEGQLLHIHPFEDFNGRVTRLFLVELLYRLELPIIDPAPVPGADTERYFAALAAYDRRDNQPLIAIWRERFEQEMEP